MSAIKINRARKLAVIGDSPRSFAAMVEAIPANVIAALTSRQIGDLADANWRLAGQSKSIAARETISEGGVWDVRREKFRPLCA